VLVDRLLEAADKCNIKKIALAGGVAANSRLRKELDSRSAGYEIYYPSLPFCTDNAAMIASSAYYEFVKGNLADMNLNAIPYLDIDN
jgi:N6-L-threonylcarbamoyladenine synthase